MFPILKKAWARQETLEQKLFWISLSVFTLVSFAGTLITVAENVNHLAEIACFVDFFVCILMALYVRKTSRYSVGFFVLIFFFACISSPLLFFLCAGVDSAMPYYLLAGPFLSSFIDNRKLRYFSAFLSMLVGILVYVVAWFCPELLTAAPSKGIVYLDFAANYVLIGGSMFLISSFAINAYVKERIQREHFVSRLDYQSKHDQFTELYNRRYVIQYLENIVWHSRDHFYMFMFTIDDLKQVNDTYGHAVGDRVISDVAHCLWECVNEDVGECGARYGEETFLFIMSADSDVDAFVRADNFREKIWKLSWSSSPLLHLTISGGIVPCRDENEFDRERLLKKVDNLLDGFKSRSRNQVRSLAD